MIPGLGALGAGGTGGLSGSSSANSQSGNVSTGGIRFGSNSGGNTALYLIAAVAVVYLLVKK